jgi:hypothetical protein
MKCCVGVSARDIAHRYPRSRGCFGSVLLIYRQSQTAALVEAANSAESAEFLHCETCRAAVFPSRNVFVEALAAAGQVEAPCHVPCRNMTALRFSFTSRNRD